MIAGNITLTPLFDKNSILKNTSLQHEAGYCASGQGNWQVSMFCPMPGVSTKMIEWWFWWHPQESVRYQVWFPGAHFSISYHKKDADYFGCDHFPPFCNNIQYPVETIGARKSSLEIDFVSPEEFGFSRDVMNENCISLIVCGHVGVKGLLKHTEMAHMFRETEEGLFMFSRFWMGDLLKSKMLKKFALTESLAKSMAEHCCIEYRNLTEILPVLYQEYGR